jgi:hypothetical protein
MKSLHFLYKNDVTDRGNSIKENNDPHDRFNLRVANDQTYKIKIKRKFKYSKEIVQRQVVLTIITKIGTRRLCYQCQE